MSAVQSQLFTIFIADIDLSGAVAAVLGCAGDCGTVGVFWWAAAGVEGTGGGAAVGGDWLLGSVFILLILVHVLGAGSTASPWFPPHGRTSPGAASSHARGGAGESTE